MTLGVPRLLLIRVVVLVQEKAYVGEKLCMAVTDRGVGECVLPELLQGRQPIALGHLVILKHVNVSNTITNLPAQELDRIVEELWVRDLQRLVLLVEGGTACGAKCPRVLSLRATGESTTSQQDGFNPTRKNVEL